MNTINTMLQLALGCDLALREVAKPLSPTTSYTLMEFPPFRRKLFDSIL